jgi:hypothetical protein
MQEQPETEDPLNSSIQKENKKSVVPQKVVEPLKKTMETAARTAGTAARVLPFVSAKAKEYSWKELQDIEDRRRNVLPRDTLGFWEVLLSWDGTCIGLLVTDALLWITLALYVGVRLSIRYGSVPTFVDSLGTGDVTVLGGFLTFFLVLYVNKSHSRYFEEYNKSMACKGRIFDVATLTITHLPNQPPCDWCDT